MKLTKIPFKSQKNETTLDKGTDRLIRGCFAQKECAGIFRFGTFALNSLEKIKQIIREEMNAIDCYEINLPILQDASIWEKSGRKNAYGDEKFKLNDRKGAMMFLAPTAEESATEFVANLVNSYKQLPINVFQMIDKYRDEMRPRFGLIRSRQFTMKDAYSFDRDAKNADETYVKYYNAYLNIFKRMNIEVWPVPGETGEIGGKYTHEFVVIDSSVAECDMYYDKLINDKLNSIEDINNLQTSFTDKYKNKTKCLELAQTYYLGESYSDPMKANFNDENGERKNFIMGCYGIGVTRILSFVAENMKYFPDAISPYKIHIIGINQEVSEEIYTNIINKSDVLFDDRDQAAGTKFNDADLIGVGHRIIIGKSLEYHNLHKETITTFEDKNKMIDFINNFLSK